MPEGEDRSPRITELFSIPLENREIAFMYLGYAGVILRLGCSTVAIDVANLLSGKEIANVENFDLLLFTHSHRDHYDFQTTTEIFETTDAQIVAQQLVAEDLMRSVPSNRLTAAKPDAILSVDDFEIVAIDGVHPGPISLYSITKEGWSIFHGGDSGYVPVKRYPADLAFLPTGTPSPSCSPETALKFALDLQPQVAVATHGTLAQMDRFKKIVEKKMTTTSVIIPKAYEPKKLTL